LQIKSDYSNAYYNKAACYALQGQAQFAIENLQQAIKLNPSHREEAQADPDFEALSKDRRFQQEMGE
jgi:tetratricopeptide (TPR) repeat protein